MDNSQQNRVRVEQEREKEKHLQHLRERESIDKVFTASTTKFKLGNNEVLRALGTVTFDADGVPHAGQVSLSDALKNYAQVNPHAVASNIAETHDAGQSSVRSKADLKTVRDRVDYIAAHGELAFARLPATAPDTSSGQPTTYAEYLRLPMSERSKLVGQNGTAWLSKLQRAASEQSRLDKLSGKPAGR